jgi:hypothetical protein
LSAKFHFLCSRSFQSCRDVEMCLKHCDCRCSCFCRCLQLWQWVVKFLGAENDQLHSPPHLKYMLMKAMSSRKAVRSLRIKTSLIASSYAPRMLTERTQVCTLCMKLWSVIVECHRQTACGTPASDMWPGHLQTQVLCYMVTLCWTQFFISWEKK